MADGECGLDAARSAADDHHGDWFGRAGDERIHSTAELDHPLRRPDRERLSGNAMHGAKLRFDLDIERADVEGEPIATGDDDALLDLDPFHRRANEADAGTARERVE